MNDFGLLMQPHQVQKLLSISSTKFHEIKKLACFPKARSIPGTTTPYFLRKEIEDWVDNLEKVKQ